MKTKELLEKLEGVHTIKSVMRALNISSSKAIYYLFRLRKYGYVKTKRLSDNTRVYNISFENKLGGTSYYEIINTYSPIKISTPKIYLLYGKKNLIEETIIFAIKTRDIRTILASLALFSKIENWGILYHLAKKNNALRKVGALYDLARTCVHKTRRMPKKFMNNSIPGKEDKFEYLVEKFKSNDFKHIENKWKVYLPFNKPDLEDYK